MSDENEIQSEDNLIEWRQIDDVIKAATSGESAVQLGSHTMQVKLDFKLSKKLPIAEAAEMLAEAVADLGAKVEVTPGMVVDADDELKPGYHILFTGEFGEFETAFVSDVPTMTEGEYQLTLQGARGAIGWLIRLIGGADGHE